ncbi:hypothetical protein AUC70_04520 [Methyloceanibacter stevinii]|uniref:Autotransporter domain-containing protein n=1 Tax=Methyloceanibacter stevinii TaxID=1774970 RepID=A0A1E3VNB9_9HYPH|nr:autotransporter outer membrane beta-barrel domain-containing protein [Methyloceanibacter stevinii]ODR95019.1 hypothetical protein AUC70_04520 [Methyloceanibacter stevinii]
MVSTGLIDITSLGRGIRSVFTNSLITLHDFTANTVDDGIAADRRATVVIDGSQVSIVTTGADAKGLLADRGAKIFIDPAGGTGSLSFDSFVRLNTAGASISTQGDDAHGIQSRANAGNADIEFLQGSIETTGDSAEGAYALINGGTGAATITMSGGSVTTGGEDSEGLVALVQPFGGGDATATLSGGQVTTTGDGSTGVLAQANLGGDARAEQSDGTIQTAGDAASHGLLAFSGLGNATTNQSGGSTSTTGADSHALYAAASAANASITQAASGTAEASGQNSAGVRAEALGTAAISVAGLVSGGWDTAAGIEARGFAGSTVNIASSSSVGALSDRAILGSFNSPTDITSAGILTGFVDLAGGDDSFANSGRWNVRNWADTTGDGMRDTIGVATSDFGGGTDLFTNTGTVALATVPGSGGVEEAVFDNLERFENAGLLTMADGQTGGGGPMAGDRITISGEYAGQDGQVNFDTFLGGDSSATDRLIVGSTAAGTSFVRVFNTNGPGIRTKQGIKIVDVDGASNGDFVLIDGDYHLRDGKEAVVAGAFAYGLYQVGGDWYLRNVEIPQSVMPEVPDGAQGGFSPVTSVYENYPQVLLAMNGLPTLQQRVGNRYWSGLGAGGVSQPQPGSQMPFAVGDEPGPAGSPSFAQGQGVWARIVGSDSKLKPRYSTAGVIESDIDILGMQGGIDVPVYTQENGSRLIAGVTGHYANGNAKSKSVQPREDSIDTEGYGVGTTLTWYDQTGFYLDGQFQYSWYESDLVSGALGRLASDKHDAGYALSLEGGQRVALAKPGVSLTPQAQLVYSTLSIGDYRDDFTARFGLEDGDSLIGRLGVALDQEKTWESDDGSLRRTHVYGLMNLEYEFLGGTTVLVSDVQGLSVAALSQEQDRLWGGLGLGGSYNWDGERFSIYAEGGVKTGLDHFGDSYALTGDAGIRVRW